MPTYRDELLCFERWDKVNEREIALLTNHLHFAAATIGAIYRDRWEIELFFKVLKQHLKIKTFIGTSPNALKTQICSENTHSCREGWSLKGHFITEAFDAVYGVIYDALRIEKVMEASAKVLVDGIVLEHSVYDDEDAVSYGDKGTFLPAPGCQAMIEAGEIPSFHSNGAPANFNQD